MTFCGELTASVFGAADDLVEMLGELVIKGPFQIKKNSAFK